MIKEIYKNTEFTCHAKNQIGATKRVLNVIVTGKKEIKEKVFLLNFFLLGPGSAPIIRGINAARTSIEASWNPPHTQNRVITSYDVFYTNNSFLPVKQWQKETVQG